MHLKPQERVRLKDEFLPHLETRTGSVFSVTATQVFPVQVRLDDGKYVWLHHHDASPEKP